MNKEVSTKAKIRFNDCDPIGHLNNAKYLEYMFNAREDHVEEFYGFTYEGYTKNTGCTWVTILNEIAYLKEVRYNTTVTISSKTISIGDKTSIIEILMKSEDEKQIYAILWTTVVYFDLTTRKSISHPPETEELFRKFLVSLDETTFKERVLYFRKENRNNSRL